jgi:hypothetical protein
MSGLALAICHQLLAHWLGPSAISYRLFRAVSREIRNLSFSIQRQGPWKLFKILVQQGRNK